MTNISGQLVLPSLGKRSPILNFYKGNLRRAYYFTNAALFLLVLAVVGFAKYQQWQFEQLKKRTGSESGKKVITLTYAQLGPPPSIQGVDAGAPTGATGARPSAPVVGVPRPVPDAQAVVETSPDQSVISGTSMLDVGTGTGTGTGTEIRIEEIIPDINAYVPVDAPPKAIVQKAPVYPEIAKKVGMEGTTFIKALLDLDGSIMRVVILKSSGFPQLDTAAVRCVLDWKFSPALQNKRPVRVWVGAPIRFSLQ